MGYTHYWYTIKEGLPQREWNSFCHDLAHVNALIIRDSSMLGSALTYDKDKVIIDGGNACHETFWLERVNTLKRFDGEEMKCDGIKGAVDFRFCKTARKPYDKYVVMILALAERYFNTFDDVEMKWDKKIVPHSDGGWQDVKDDLLYSMIVTT